MSHEPLELPLADFDPIDGLMPASLRSVFIKVPAASPAETSDQRREPPMIAQGAAALALLVIPFALAIITALVTS